VALRDLGKPYRETPAVERRGESRANSAVGVREYFREIAMHVKGTDAMSTRITRTELVFMHPFILDGMDAVQPAGSYTVETEEESLDTILSPAWRRVQTVMVIVNASQTEYLPITPDQLHEALMRDGVLQDSASPLSPDSPKARHSMARDMRLPS
jgi:hypothetical protein